MTTQYLSQNDYDQYGSDLLNVSQRAALNAVAPELQQIRQQNAALNHRLAVESRRRLDQAVELAVPNYREIDRNPAWHRWLVGIDNLSGRVRQSLLNEAINNGHTAQVVAFFRTFEREHGGASASQAPQAAAIPYAARGRSARMSDRPVYTRAEIAKLYRRHQQGAYANREAEWLRQELDIVAAAREGRVIGAVTDLRGK